jgi:glycosyltransferase involved in cell wall biosynthesis
MIQAQRVAVVLPAYNAEQTLARVIRELPRDVVDDVILVDDASRDETAIHALALGLRTYRHRRNLGYGGNQKTCYAAALDCGADIIVMVHPDYQYSPRLVGAMAWMLASDEYDVILASRILGKGARKGGMPAYKYYFNRLLTAFQNLLMGVKLSEFHTGYRAFKREVIETLPLEENSDDFVFDNQMIAQAVHFGFRLGEISCPTRYFPEASSINFRRSVKYGFGVLATSVAFRLQAMGAGRYGIFSDKGRRLEARRLLDEELVETFEEPAGGATVIRS